MHYLFIAITVKRKIFFPLSFFTTHTYFVSAFLSRWSLRYHKSLLFLGTNNETARARNCQPWINVKEGGLIFGSAGRGWPLPKVGEAFCAPEESHKNSDCVAQRSKFWEEKKCMWDTLKLIYKVYFKKGHNKSHT